MGMKDARSVSSRVPLDPGGGFCYYKLTKATGQVCDLLLLLSGLSERPLTLGRALDETG